MSIKVDRITDSIAHHGEGPVWLDDIRGLRWVDQLAGDVLSLSDSGAITREHVGTIAAVLRPRVGGGVAIATADRLLLERDAGQPAVGLRKTFTDSSIRFNDGGCSPDGRFYIGTMAFDEAPGRGSLYCFMPDHSCCSVLENVTVSNGLAWSPNGQVAYYVDSATGRVDQFDYDTTGLRDRRPFVSITSAAGIPDGLTVDAEGGVWVALWGGSAVHRYDAAGRLTAELRLPASRVTACTFGGPELTDLYITTSRLGMNADTEPQAGSLFKCTPGVQGLAAAMYGG